MSEIRPLIEGSVFSHGTMDSRNAEKTQRFLQEFLGIRSVRKSKGTQYVWQGGRWNLPSRLYARGGRCGV